MKTAEKLSNSEYRELALKAANNHSRMECFVWWGAPDDSELWCLVYTSNRDSCALDRANHKVITTELEQFGDDVRAESHSHWACGHVDGFAIRVYRMAGRSRRITAAFKRWAELNAAMEDYPILDESILSEEEQMEIDESWECWIRYDFTRELERLWEIDLTASDSQLRELFDNACQETGSYPEHSGSEVICKVDRIADHVSEESLKQHVPAIGIKLFRDGAFHVAGELHLRDYSCDMPLYADEFLAAMEAREQGAESMTIGHHVFTWSVE